MTSKKKVLVVQCSQSGQLTDVVERIVAPLCESADIEIVVETVRTVAPYPFPWPVLKPGLPGCATTTGCMAGEFNPPPRVVHGSTHTESRQGPGAALLRHVPESVYLDPPPLEPFRVDPAQRFDLVIVGD